MTQIDEVTIARLVNAFYERVRADELLGPIFNAHVKDWPEHLTNLQAFWCMVILRTGDYSGRPLAPHLMLSPKGEHFDRWLALFEETARSIVPAAEAAVFVDRARRIADSFELAIGSAEGRIVEPRHVQPRTKV
jgi:hemoglobin